MLILSANGSNSGRTPHHILVRKLALELMDAVLESLGLDQACLLEKLEEGIQLMAMNCYQTSQHLHDCTFGMPPHSDYGCLTILFQSCEGLEIIDRSNGNWKAVPETPESLHVHIGDHLEVLSNGRYKSVVHRVVYNSRCRRISIASIQGLSMDQKVITAEELVDEKHPTAYKDTSFREFLQYLLSTDYANGVSYIDSLRIFNP
ncbi:hypothetical protein HPP92_014896 [Vanilla planifolia]|uniref:Fe2OG dioxygenase domain-containing protein n=1 Tax=Vanilla planifolia TaxID=51239 RepID=A0A835QNI0_VANPL|nr:hypothetical protein HPP92_014896 [Vanilla planifolia]